MTTKNTLDQDKSTSPWHRWLWIVAAAGGFFIHAGTAVLRLRNFFPVPILLDFSAFYAAAAAVSHRLSPYGLSSDWLVTLRAERTIPVVPPPIYNPPLWPWMLQPLSVLPFPTAAWLWLLGNSALLVCIAVFATQVFTPGYPEQTSVRRDLPRWATILFVYVLIVTFGPVFLDLSLGQTSILLLVMCMTVAPYLCQTVHWHKASVLALAITLASVTKLYPAVWLAVFPLLRRWKIVILTGQAAAGFLQGLSIHIYSGLTFVLQYRLRAGRVIRTLQQLHCNFR